MKILKAFKILGIIILLIAFLFTVSIMFMSYRWDKVEEKSTKDSIKQFELENFRSNIFNNKNQLKNIINYLNRQYPLLRKSSNNRNIHINPKDKTTNLEIDSLTILSSSLIELNIKSISIQSPDHHATLKENPGIILNMDIIPNGECTCRSTHYIYSNKTYFLNKTIVNPYNTLVKDSILFNNINYVIEVMPHTL